MLNTRGNVTLLQKLLVGVSVFLLTLPLFVMTVLRPLEPHWRSLRYVDVSLSGAESKGPMPRLVVRDVMDSSFQPRFQAWFDQHLGMRGRLVRMNNQIDYSLFHKTRMSTADIVIGKDRWLYETSYVRDWLGKAGAISDQHLDEFVARLLKFQARLAMRGQQFVFVISPSKASIYPEYVPEKRSRPEGQQRNYDRLLERLELSGVLFVDGHALMRDAKQQFAPVPVFCRGGTHWNQLGAHVMARSVLDVVAGASHLELPQLTLDACPVDRKPEGTDKDLARLLNLVWEPADYEVPHPQVSVANSVQVEPTRMIAVGGSFVFQLMDAWKASEGFDALTYLYYYKRHIDYIENPWDRPSLEEHPLDWEREAFSADIVILELNESGIGSKYPLLFIEDFETKLDELAGQE